MRRYSRDRQRSCIACVDGKRRCDRKFPQCSRCVIRGCQCKYTNGVNYSSNTDSQANTDTQTNINTQSNPDTQSFQIVEHPASLFSEPETFLTETLFSPHAACLDRWSISQLVAGVKSFPVIFARALQTPFIHARLYDDCLPEAMQEAFTVSSTYLSRTPHTAAWLARTIEAKAVRIVQKDPTSCDLLDLLARVQALILFQIIQLFDGDVRQRFIAEQHLGILRAWTAELQARSYALAIAGTWQDWVCAESVRRTIIFSLIIDGLYSTLKLGYCTTVPMLSMLSFTPEMQLWNAVTSTSWLAGHNFAGSGAVHYGDFISDWKNGQFVGNLDAGLKLLIIPCVGEEYREVLEGC